jgi:hypothetical protein
MVPIDSLGVEQYLRSERSWEIETKVLLEEQVYRSQGNQVETRKRICEEMPDLIVL